MERKRRCGWTAEAAAERSRPVWVSRIDVEGELRTASLECPVSYVRAESWTFLEDYFAHRNLGGGGTLEEWPARRVDAFLTLEAEMNKMERPEDG